MHKAIITLRSIPITNRDTPVSFIKINGHNRIIPKDITIITRKDMPIINRAMISMVNTITMTSMIIMITMINMIIIITIIMDHKINPLLLL